MVMNLLEDIKNKKITYDQFAERFFQILDKEKNNIPLSEEDLEFLKASLEVFKTNPKELI